MLTKDQIEKLIDQLASKELSFGCRVEWGKKNHIVLAEASTTEHKGCYRLMWENGFLVDRGAWIPKEHFKILGHPIYIGDVLARWELNHGIMLTRETRGYLCEEWENCGTLFKDKQALDKSLQQIISESGWEIIPLEKENMNKLSKIEERYYLPGSDQKQLKSPQATALLEFINDMYNK